MKLNADRMTDRSCSASSRQRCSSEYGLVMLEKNTLQWPRLFRKKSSVAQLVHPITSLNRGVRYCISCVWKIPNVTIKIRSLTRSHTQSRRRKEHSRTKKEEMSKCKIGHRGTEWYHIYSSVDLWAKNNGGKINRRKNIVSHCLQRNLFFLIMRIWTPHACCAGLSLL